MSAAWLCACSHHSTRCEVGPQDTNVLTPPRIKKNNQDKIGLPSDKVRAMLRVQPGAYRCMRPSPSSHERGTMPGPTESFRDGDAVNHGWFRPRNLSGSTGHTLRHSGIAELLLSLFLSAHNFNGLT
jgi:hypothetical protein